MNRLRHILVSASAGSGKTYQLVRRYLHLLALGQPPEAVAAMTFTRKAAGEFFQRILQRLSALSQHQEKPEEYLAGMVPQPVLWPEFAVLLRQVTQRLHRLRLGTMDSFFANITACFPLELGLPLGASVMAENEAAQARHEALDALLERIHSSRDDAAGRALLEGFKQATFGVEERSAVDSLESWINDHHATWLDSEGISQWGALPALDISEDDDLAAALDELRNHFVPARPKSGEFMEQLLSLAAELEPGHKPEDRVEDFLKKSAASWRELRAGNAVVTWGGGKNPVFGEAARAWVRVAEALLKNEIKCRAQRTRGMAALMELYEAEYARRVRSRGRLSFADVQRLLAEATQGGAGWMDHERGDLWFRLDGRYDHWLFDEFQDTSRVQWNVVRGLVDEVMQDDSGRRSFYAVGDPKQSIYLWRQAEPGLFDDVVREWPHRGEDGLEPQTLSQSFRSAPPVLSAVNAVFENKEGIESLLPGCTSGFAFKKHEAAERNQRLAGYAALLSVPKEEGVRNPSTTPALVSLLNEIRPLERGLSCAVLVRGNKKANEIAEELRTETGMEVVCESQQYPATDNAVTLALLSLLQLSAHPADTLALEHLKMTPLWTQIDSAGQGWPLTCHQVRESVFERGFVGFTEVWTRLLRELLPEMDAFHELRLRQFGEIAAEFDAGGSRDIDQFLQHARDMPMQVRGAASAVQVMTIHKAKGLEFDVVLLPDLDGEAMNQVRRRSLIVNRDGRGISWVLQEPPRIFAPLHEALNEEMETSKQRSGFESLCRLYVAMTRAKCGLYLIAEPPPKKEDAAMKESQFLRRMLGVAGDGQEHHGYLNEWETGDAQWFADLKGEKPEYADVKTAGRPLGELLREFQPMAKRVTPSGEEDFQVKGSVLFSAGREPGRRLGSLVHELLARVEWWDADSSMEDLESLWRASGLLRGDEIEKTAVSMVRGVLASEAADFAFTRPSAEAEAWRERPFDLIHDGSWISGVFDRVVVLRDSVRLIDFKTDDVADENSLAEKVAGYRPQIVLYQKALARLTGLPTERIKCALLFTRNSRLVDVN
ncbi:UvrD-helicase domain-containing protein [Prosthecobacter sp.]|uniref:UvrD-helicase domain-containing protein n=1 Tax=Prosthecobacter sp. TaxID=1965333 RepID=UPI001DEB1FFC|nr:UvrD-helicase domain-containing protein [Prosthecobacter sp.]MCB1277187.1 UvrD-helicase domain-containing protein [Prosthecobacter sp.]